MIWKTPHTWWEEDPVVILAGGPSLKTQDLSKVWSDAIHIITINDSWRLLPYPNPFTIQITDCGPGLIPYFCDAKWWQMEMSKNSRSLDNNVSFHDMIYKGFWVTSSQEFNDHPQVRTLKLTGEQGLELDPTGLRHGSNSGYQAINLAVNLGAKKIILLGYDMQIVNGKSHWHNEPRQPNVDFKLTLAKSMLPHFESLIEPLNTLGVEVFNATPNSALKCFPEITLEEALP